MKKLIFISLILFGFIACTSIPKEVVHDKGSLYPLKSPQVYADVYFDYTNCIVNGKTALYGPDAAGDEITETIINDLNGGESSFIATFKKNNNTEHCQLIPEGNNSPYKIEVKIISLHRTYSKVLFSKSRSVLMGANIYVIERASSDTIAAEAFTAMGSVNRGILNDPEYDYLTKLCFSNLANDFTWSIKKAKEEKTKK